MKLVAVLLCLFVLGVCGAPLRIGTNLVTNADVNPIAAFRASVAAIRTAIINNNGAADSYIVTWPRSDGNIELTLNNKLTGGGSLYLVAVTGTGDNAFTWSAITEASSMANNPSPISLLTYGPSQINWNPTASYLNVKKIKESFFKSDGKPYMIKSDEVKKKMVDSLAGLVEAIRLFAVEDRIVTDSFTSGTETNFQALRKVIHDWKDTSATEVSAGNLNAAAANTATVAVPILSELAKANTAYKNALLARITTQGQRTTLLEMKQQMTTHNNQGLMSRLRTRLAKLKHRIFDRRV